MNVLAECKSYDELQIALRERWQELRITNEAVDELSGVQSGYSSKVLGPNPTKQLGPVSWALLPVLGVKLIVVDDAEARSAMQGRYVPKTEARSTPRVAKVVKQFLSSAGAAGARALNERLTPAQRRKSARRAARARWAK